MQVINKRLVLSVLVRWRCIVLSLVWTLLLSHTVLAANWVYVQRLEGTRFGACTEYVDADSVIKNEGKITYWTIWVLDEDTYRQDIWKILRKKEALVSNFSEQNRILEQYYFNTDNEEIRRYLKPVKEYGLSDDEIIRILGYGKEGISDAPQPDHSLTPQPRWYGTMKYDDYDLHWDIHSIVAWPQDHPTTIDIRVKKVWSQEALEGRKAFLISLQKPYRRDYEGLTYTLVNYRFSINEARVRILQETDYDRQGQRMTVVSGSKWENFDSHSSEAAVKKIALNWLSSSAEN